MLTKACMPFDLCAVPSATIHPFAHKQVDNVLRMLPPCKDKLYRGIGLRLSEETYPKGAQV